MIMQVPVRHEFYTIVGNAEIEWDDEGNVKVAVVVKPDQAKALVRDLSSGKIRNIAFNA